MFYVITQFVRQLRRRRGLGVLVLLSALGLSVLGNTASFYYFERTLDSPPTISDSLWYSLISIATIGYGDFSATTLGARIGTAVFIVVIGLASFTTAVGMMVDWIADLRDKERTGMCRSRARDHLIIVNFPSESRVRRIIAEYTRDSRHRNCATVVVSDQIEELPFALDNVSFIRGGPLEEETYERANIAHAGHAIILSTSHDDPRSDSFVASVVFVIEHVNPRISIVAECLDIKHAALFNVSKRVSLVYSLRMANNLLVQESLDPGVNLLTQAITSREIEGTLASTTVEEAIPEGPLAYTDVAKKLLDYGVNLVGVIRDDAVILSFGEQACAKDDVLVYVSKTRHSWQYLCSLLR